MSHPTAQFKTNRYSMKLGLFASVHAIGATRVLAACLLIDESEDSFVWVFQEFLRHFGGVATEVMLTDSDPWMRRAAQRVMPDSHLNGCTWHLSKNVNSNVHPALTGNASGWYAVNALFWKMAKESDTQSIATLDAHFDELVAAVEHYASAGEARAKAVSWLRDTLYVRREEWAARFTWRVFTAGCDADQRVESVNNAIKDFLTASTLLTTLVKQLDQYNKSVDTRALTRMHRLEQTALRCLPSPLLDQLRLKLSPYAMQIERAQMAESAFYKSVPQEGSPGTFIVSRRVDEGSSAAASAASVDWEEEADAADLGLSRMFSRQRITSLESCSCQFHSHWGLFCRHQLHVAVVTQVDSLPKGVISRTWELLDEDASHARLMELLALRRPTDAAAGGSWPSMTKDERYAAAMAAAKPLAELASTSDVHLSSVVASLSELTMNARRNATGGAAATRAAQAQLGRGSQAGKKPASGKSPALHCCKRCGMPMLGHKRGQCSVLAPALAPAPLVELEGEGEGEGVEVLLVATKKRRRFVLESDDDDDEDETGAEEDGGEGTAAALPQVLANPLVLRGKGRPQSKRFRSATENRTKSRR